jgi:hypothetical protein
MVGWVAGAKNWIVSFTAFWSEIVAISGSRVCGGWLGRPFGRVLVNVVA